MSIADIIKQQQTEANTKICIQAVKENIDQSLKVVIDELEDAGGDFKDHLMQMSWREILLALTASSMGSSAPAFESEDSDEEEEEEVEEVEEEEEEEEDEEEEEVVAAPKRRKRAAPTAKSPTALKAPVAKTSSPDYHKAVKKAVKKFKEGAALADVQGEVGGSPAQVRAVLNRLIEDGELSKEGSTRSTRYFVA